MSEVAQLENQLTAVVKQMTESQTIDEVYFGLMRRERELKAKIYEAHEPQPPTNADGSPRLWAEWELKLIRDTYQTTEANQLAKVLGVTREEIYSKTRALGLIKTKTKNQ